MSNVRVTIVGDVVFNWGLAADPVGAAGRISPELREHLASDILVANLESTFGKPVAQKWVKREILATTAPVETADALKRLGVDAVTLANNHVFDGGEAGLVSTMSALKERGVACFGAGLDYAAASAPCVLERGGLKVGFLGFAGGVVAGRNKPGTLYLGLGSSCRLIRRLRRGCDFLVVYFHEGIEATSYPMRATMRVCRRAVDCGADLVVGTHPHTIQGIEWYKGVPIAYSLGNFIMPLLDPEAYARWQPQTALARLGIAFDRKLISRALILKCTFSPGGPAQVEAVPVVVQESGLPRLPTDQEAEEERAFFESLCQAFGRPADPVWRLRDEIERGNRRLDRSDISWGYILRYLYRLRPRHVVSYLKPWL